jgi:hypothetical protein
MRDIKSYILNLIFYFEIGKGKVLGRIYGWWNEPLIIFIFLKQMGINLSWLEMILIVAVLVVLVVFTGRLYIQKDLYRIERRISTVQDPILMGIYEDIQKLKKRLNKCDLRREK